MLSRIVLLGCGGKFGNVGVGVVLERGAARPWEIPLTRGFLSEENCVLCEPAANVGFAGGAALS